MQVTNGTVTFSRKLKPADYEGKEAEVSLSFAVAEGEDAEAIVAEVAAIAQRRAMIMLGLPEQSPVQGLVAEPPKAPRKPAAKAPILIGVKEPADPLALPAGAVTAPAPAASNGAAEPNAASLASDPLALTADMQVSDNVTDLYSPSPADVAPISEKELMDAIGSRNAIIKNAVAIRGLLGKFITAPQTAKDIPQDKRADFIRELNALQPA